MAEKKLVHDVWLGDSAELCKRFIPKRQIRSIITDPPFGIDNQSRSAVTPHGKDYARKIANDESPEKAIEVFRSVMEVAIQGMKDDSDIYVFTAFNVLEQWTPFLRELFEPHGFRYKALLVWEKGSPGMGDLDTWGMGGEFILYFKRGKWERFDRRRNFVLNFPTVPAQKLIHPHEKPLPLLESFIKHSTEPGDFVVDPFGGSGSLVRAAQRMGRSAVAIELDEKNQKLALQALSTGDPGLF